MDRTQRAFIETDGVIELPPVESADRLTADAGSIVHLGDRAARGAEVAIQKPEENLVRQLEELINQHPSGQFIDQKAQETIGLYERGEGLKPTEDAPDQEPRFSLSGASDETFEMLQSRGLVSPEEVAAKEVNLAAVTFLKLYRTSTDKSPLEGQNGDLAAQIIQNRSRLYFQSLQQ